MGCRIWSETMCGDGKPVLTVPKQGDGCEIRSSRSQQEWRIALLSVSLFVPRQRRCNLMMPRSARKMSSLRYFASLPSSINSAIIESFGRSLEQHIAVGALTRKRSETVRKPESGCPSLIAAGGVELYSYQSGISFRDPIWDCQGCHRPRSAVTAEDGYEPRGTGVREFTHANRQDIELRAFPHHALNEFVHDRGCCDASVDREASGTRVRILRR